MSGGAEPRSGEEDIQGIALGRHAAEAVGSGREPFVVVKGVVKRYPGVQALDHANAVIVPGAIVGLLGKNGAGKSTLIKILAGVVQPDEGEVLVDGEPVHFTGAADATRRGFAFVHQELTDVPNLSVAENIELGLGYPKVAGAFVDRRALRKKAAEALERLGAPIDPASSVGGLSIAERRLVVIARGLAQNARLLVLDEPTASLTEDEIAHLHDVLRGLRDAGVAIVYVTHRLQEVFDVTDDIAVMRDGRMVFEAPTARVTRTELIQHITGTAITGTAERWRPPADAERKEILRVEGLGLPGVVDDASFAVSSGDVLGIAGLVGAGRTELVRMIFGADRAASGKVFMHGQPVRLRGPRDAMKAGIVLLPEDRRREGAVITFSVRKNITLPTLERFRFGALPMPSVAREREAAVSLIERLQIKVAHIENPVSTLSGGNQQKVVLAKWLDSGADLFIFDEPTHGIDVGAKEEIYRLMTGLASSGKGVIFISSEFPELVAVCNRVLVMREGRLVGEVDGDEITESALIERCYAA
jgi:ABC-type sugar transport system ATPase subunit